MAFPVEKREESRVTLRKPVVLTWRSEHGVGSGTVSNMSAKGCYVLTQNPLRSGEQFAVMMDNLAVPEIRCEVRYVDEHVGMGVRFIEISPEASDQIRELLRAKAATV